MCYQSKDLKEIRKQAGPTSAESIPHERSDPTISSSVSTLLILLSIFPSIRVFSNDSALLIKWPKYWNFSPTNEHSGLISFRIDWFDLFQSKGLSRVFSSTTIQKHQFFGEFSSYMKINIWKFANTQILNQIYFPHVHLDFEVLEIESCGLS